MIRCSGASMSTASCIMKRSRKVIMFPENQPAQVSLSPLTSLYVVVPHGSLSYDYALNVAVLSYSCSALAAEVMSFLIS